MNLNAVNICINGKLELGFRNYNINKCHNLHFRVYFLLISGFPCFLILE